MVMRYSVSEKELVALAVELGGNLKSIGVIFLCGDLGVGKTTFVRGLLRGMGYLGNVKSPTYSLLESYHLAAGVCHHLDLYRLQAIDELDCLDIRDLLWGKDALLLIEWPEHALDGLPRPDLKVNINYSVNKREISFQPYTDTGDNMLSGLSFRGLI